MPNICLSCPKCKTPKGNKKQICASSNTGALNKLRKHLWSKHREWMIKRIKLGKKNKSNPHNPKPFALPTQVFAPLSKISEPLPNAIRNRALEKLGWAKRNEQGQLVYTADTLRKIAEDVGELSAE